MTTISFIEYYVFQTPTVNATNNLERFVRSFPLTIIPFILLVLLLSGKTSAFICSDEDMMKEVERVVKEEPPEEIFRRLSVYDQYFPSLEVLTQICALQAMLKYNSALGEAASEGVRESILGARASLLIGQMHLREAENNPSDSGHPSLHLADRSFKRAHIRLETALEAGSPEALILSGDLYRDGRGVEASRLIAIDLYFQAANATEQRQVKLKALERIEDADESHPHVNRLREELYR